MARRSLPAGWIAVATLALGCVPPAVVPTRTGEQLPLIAIEIKNTASQSDDYVDTAPVSARIRVTNGDTLSLPVPVTLKNLEFQARPELRFGSGTTVTSTTIDLTLPLDGSWVPFVVARASTATSSRDKDAVIEVLESRANGIVLARKSLMATASPPVPATAPAIVIQIGHTPIVDDYVTWRPMAARVRLATPGSADLPVIIRNMSPTTGGRLLFGATPAVDTVIPPPTMGPSFALSLPADGSWATFQVSGEFGFPSDDDKDAVLEVVRADPGQLLGREGMMVRVRKNANRLSANERDRWLHAVARINTPQFANYVVHQWIHAVASRQAHRGPAFLPWHRVFVLRLERELQAVDPATALHYWRFDQGAAAVFDSSFMGRRDGSGSPSLAAANPLTAWSIEGFSGIRREPRFAASQAPTGNLGPFDPARRTEAQVLALGGPTLFGFASVATSEDNPHDDVHVRTGNGGWLNFVNEAVRDPLFFMLHSNVDRLWAKWQWTHVRKDPSSPLSYAPQGSYPGAASAGGVRLGHFGDDLMWPWDGTTGTQVPGDPQTTRPSTAPGGAMPAAIGGWGPRSRPRPRDVVNYDQWTLLGVSGLGYAYDDVPFSHVP